MNRAAGLITQFRVNDYVNSLCTIGVRRAHDMPANGRFSKIFVKIGDPYGNRTRVSAVKGPRPNR